MKVLTAVKAALAILFSLAGCACFFLIFAMNDPVPFGGLMMGSFLVAYLIGDTIGERDPYQYDE